MTMSRRGWHGERGRHSVAAKRGWRGRHPGLYSPKHLRPDEIEKLKKEFADIRKRIGLLPPKSREYKRLHDRAWEIFEILDANGAI